MNSTSTNPRQSFSRVFVASILSFAILIMPFAQLAAATKQRSEIRNRKSDKTPVASPIVSEGASATNLNPPIAEPAPQPLTPIGSVTATLAGAITTDADADGKADPGVDTITYTATITNNTGGDISGLQFNDTIDPHTSFVAGSAVAAVDDTYSTTTNAQINPVAAQGVLANDFNPDTLNNTGMTVSSYGKNGEELRVARSHGEAMRHVKDMLGSGKDTKC